ncbi:hypothetical protein [Sagittula sp.]|uniref:hypothetical protein n=1 Tax=Sagittula sp. TaxID=2038081 RepID=UPI003519C985
MTKNTISGLLKTRDDMMGELLALRERTAEVYNDIEAVDRVLDALGYNGPLEERTTRKKNLVIFARNELRQYILRELRKGEPLSSRDLAERICSEEGKDIADARMVMEVTRRVSKAVGLLRQRGAVKGHKDRAGRWVWLAP